MKIIPSFIFFSFFRILKNTNSQTFYAALPLVQLLTKGAQLACTSQQVAELPRSQINQSELSIHLLHQAAHSKQNEKKQVKLTLTLIIGMSVKTEIKVGYGDKADKKECK